MYNQLDPMGGPTFSDVDSTVQTTTYMGKIVAKSFQDIDC